mmetsp:Transcript_14579/g.23729  ORF Transcript_14579/g.23729 Transcript_14579/m.23729 type:complete len:150 (+) Transcript_14579:2224-2673(+)
MIYPARQAILGMLKLSSFGAAPLFPASQALSIGIPLIHLKCLSLPYHHPACFLSRDLLPSGQVLPRGSPPAHVQLMDPLPPSPLPLPVGNPFVEGPLPLLEQAHVPLPASQGPPCKAVSEERAIHMSSPAPFHDDRRAPLRKPNLLVKP